MPENESVELWDKFEEIKGLTTWESAKVHTHDAVRQLISGNPNSLIWGMLAVENILASKLGDDYVSKINQAKQEIGIQEGENITAEMRLLLAFAKLREIHNHIDKSTPLDVTGQV